MRNNYGLSIGFTLFIGLYSLSSRAVENTQICKKILVNNSTVTTNIEHNQNQAIQLLSSSERPEGLVLDYAGAQTLLQSYSETDLHENLVFVVLRVQVSAPSAIRSLLTSIDENAMKYNIHWSDSFNYFRNSSNGLGQLIEVPLGGAQANIIEFLTSINRHILAYNYLFQRFELEIIDLGDASKRIDSPISIGPTTLRVLKQSPSQTEPVLDVLENAEKIVEDEGVSVPIIQLGMSRELRGYSPMLVMIPATRDVDNAIKSIGKKIFEFTDGWTSVVNDWEKHFLKIAKGRSVYSVLTKNGHVYVLNGDNFSKAESTLMEELSANTSDENLVSFPTDLLNAVRSCLGCSEWSVSKSGTGVVDESYVSTDSVLEILNKGSRKVDPKKVPKTMLNRMQIAPTSNGAKVAFRDSFPREMNTEGAKLDQIVLRVLTRLGASEKEKSDFIKDLDSWSVNYHLEIFQWGVNQQGKCRNYFSCFMMLKIIDSLGAFYNLKGIGPAIDTTVLHTYEGMRSFFDLIGFPKIHDGNRVISSRVLVDLAAVLDAQMHAEPLRTNEFTEQESEDVNDSIHQYNANNSSTVMQAFGDLSNGGARALKEFLEANEDAQSVDFAELDTRALFSRIRIRIANLVTARALGFGGKTQLTQDNIKNNEIQLRDIGLQPNDLYMAIDQKDEAATIRILLALDSLAKLWNMNTRVRIDSQDFYLYYPLHKFLRLISEET